MLEFITLPKLLSFGQVLLDILIMAVIIYYTLKIVRNNTRTIQIFKGIFFIFFANVLSKILGFTTVTSFTEIFMTWGILAIIIIFQPEIRSVLERLGQSNIFTVSKTLSTGEKDQLINELVLSVESLAIEKTGALITIEQSISLQDFIKTGTIIDSLVSKELLLSIFQVGTPLHDGAVIIQGNHIAAASAYFPPTEEWLPSKYGARHRAGIGISEISDSITIIISEETGLVSVARDGKMSVISLEELSDYLHDALFSATKDIEVKSKEKDEEKERVAKIERDLRTAEQMEAKRLIKQFSKSKKDGDQNEK